jgi:hypothetical protein
MRYSRSNHGTRNNSIRQGRARSTTVASATNIKELNLIQHITQQLTVASFRRLARSIRTPWFALGPWPQPRRPTCARDRSPVLDFVAKTPPPLLLLLLNSSRNRNCRSIGGSCYAVTWVVIIQSGLVLCYHVGRNNSIREGAPLGARATTASEPPRTPNSNIDGTYNSTTTGRMALRLRLSAGGGLVTLYLQALPVWGRGRGPSRRAPSRTSISVALLSVGRSENQRRILRSSYSQ